VEIVLDGSKTFYENIEALLRRWTGLDP
jgi:hypothetical protein